jgi:hypothetical protein
LAVGALADGPEDLSVPPDVETIALPELPLDEPPADPSQTPPEAEAPDGEPEPTPEPEEEPEPEPEEELPLLTADLAVNVLLCDADGRILETPPELLLALAVQVESELAQYRFNHIAAPQASATFIGLPVGTYAISEIYTPVGYKLVSMDAGEPAQIRKVAPAAPPVEEAPDPVKIDPVEPEPIQTNPVEPPDPEESDPEINIAPPALDPDPEILAQSRLFGPFRELPAVTKTETVTETERPALQPPQEPTPDVPPEPKPQPIQTYIDLQGLSHQPAIKVEAQEADRLYIVTIVYCATPSVTGFSGTIAAPLQLASFTYTDAVALPDGAPPLDDGPTPEEPDPETPADPTPPDDTKEPPESPAQPLPPDLTPEPGDGDYTAQPIPPELT